ncbi:DUF2572 family protein [Pasteurella sp. PK-2025]|uniref:DUF2572 family protein n=1 Tax=unclassified Pasteurella TaxID=2621516 RepID=UPI003C74FFA6
MKNLIHIVRGAPLQRGMMSLTLCMILATLLMGFLLFDDELLHLYTRQAGYQKQFVQQTRLLQQKVNMQGQSACEHLPLTLKGNVHRLTFALSDPSGELRHYLWCHRVSLFHKAPKRGLNPKGLTEYIDLTKLAQFSPLFSTPATAYQGDKTERFYWFSAPQHRLELTGNLNAVIIAEGELVLEGKGKITGAIIAAGNIEQKEGVIVSYRKATVDYWLTTLSRWQQAEQSWHDFIPQ